MKSVLKFFILSSMLLVTTSFSTKLSAQVNIAGTWKSTTGNEFLVLKITNNWYLYTNTSTFDSWNIYATKNPNIYYADFKDKQGRYTRFYMVKSQNLIETSTTRGKKTSWIRIY